MTYVSRRTRIIVSRWPDDCDAEYTLRVYRKRSDGRLKRHNSCDDLRAWITDDHIKNEYLVDLMSDGEFSGKPPFRLYGRFIPVPILFKLTQNTEMESSEKQKNTGQYSKNNLESGNYSDKHHELKVDSSLTRIQWEKNLLEKHLVKCTSLLNIAFKKLEKIEVIVDFANEETENFKNEEVQEAFYKSKLSCTCSQHICSSTNSSLNNFSENLYSSNPKLKSLRDSTKCTELLRKISYLMEKLKKIKQCRKEVLLQIRASQQKADKCCSFLQVTELYSRRKQGHMNKLEEKYRRLIAQRGKIIFEISEALTALIALNASKRSSKLCLNTQKSHSKSRGNCDDFRAFVDCDCFCRCSETYKSSDSEKLQCSDSRLDNNDLNKKFENVRKMDNFKSYAEFPLRTSADCENGDLEQFFNEHYSSAACTKAQQKDSEFLESVCTSPGKFFKRDQQQVSSYQKKYVNAKVKKEDIKTAKVSKVKFVCEESPCRKKLNADDLADFENSLTPEQRMVIQKALQNVKNIQDSRPSTSPTTKREKQIASLESKPICKNLPREQSFQPLRSVPERRVKSETTMKEIEKTLRNYEQRLCDLDSLEDKVEDLKEKSLEAYRLRKRLANVKAEAKRQRATDKEISNREITRLCTENWELKKQIQQLKTKFDSQNQKIQSLKFSSFKAKELECEAEELKKELMEYRDIFEHQKKYISKWKSVVAMQRTEIENLMNHIRKLTTMREESSCNPWQDKRYVQRSRSYSPEKIKQKAQVCRPKTQARTFRPSSEEEELCCCRNYSQQEGRGKSQLSSSDKDYCFQINERMGWCN